uniref:accessory gene regulator B family protein n=1 Tax=Paenibacillus sp. FSL K6-1318 TaxID=2975291 RepID=UPI00403F44A4
MLSLFIGLCIGKLKEIITIMISFAILRSTSGGIHLKSGDKCVVVTTVLFTVISLIDLSTVLILLLNSLSILLAFMYAPSRIEEQSKIDPIHYPKLRILSIIIIATNFLFMSSVIAIAFFVQCLTLIKLKEVKQ